MYSGFFVMVSEKVLDKKRNEGVHNHITNGLANTFLAPLMPRVAPFSCVITPIILAIDDSNTVSNKPLPEAAFEGTVHVLRSISKNTFQNACSEKANSISVA